MGTSSKQPPSDGQPTIGADTPTTKRNENMNHIMRRMIVQAKVREVVRKGVGVLAQTKTPIQPKK